MNLKNEILKRKRSSFCFLKIEKILTPGKEIYAFQNGKKSEKKFIEVFKNKPQLIAISEINCSSGNEYEKAVNNRLRKENSDLNFEKQERKWGTRIENSSIIEYKKEFFFEYNNLNPNWKNNKITYKWENGKNLTKKELEKLSLFLKPNYIPKNQGTKNHVLIKAVNFNKIKEFKGFGIEYKNN
jgi:hypothetical protein